MYLPKRSHNHSLATLQREIDSLFGNFLDLENPWGSLTSGSALEAFRPRVEVCETKSGIEVQAELPGMNEKDIQVSLAPSHDALILRGEKKNETETKHEGYFHTERTFGSFYREIPLRCEVNPENVQATYKKGVLCVKLERSPETQKETKQIPIKFS
jgi:HSP20 family protein